MASRSNIQRNRIHDPARGDHIAHNCDTIWYHMDFLAACQPSLYLANDQLFQWLTWYKWRCQREDKPQENRLSRNKKRKTYICIDTLLMRRAMWNKSQKKCCITLIRRKVAVPFSEPQKPSNKSASVLFFQKQNLATRWYGVRIRFLFPNRKIRSKKSRAFCASL